MTLHFVWGHLLKKQTVYSFRNEIYMLILKIHIKGSKIDFVINPVQNKRYKILEKGGKIWLCCLVMGVRNWMYLWFVRFARLNWCWGWTNCLASPPKSLVGSCGSAVPAPTAKQRKNKRMNQVCHSSCAYTRFLHIPLLISLFRLNHAQAYVSFSF